MCGIAGIINYKDYNLEALKQSLFHRGPDDQSIFIEDNLALIHTRLAIQDAAHGAQPFHYQHYSIIYNGEIYNHKDLRHLLSEFSFHSDSDTETLLYLYIKYDEAMFTMLDGMFAFCIYDRKNNNLVLARDRVGKKPLYFINDKDSFLFASELNAIKLIKNLEIDEEVIGSFLRAGFIYKNYTPYKNVLEIEPASYMLVNLENRQIKTKKYYNLLESYYNENKILNIKDAILGIEENLQKSVTDRLISSDVPVGIFLSGGIDSNLIVAMAAKCNKNLKTFTVKFNGLYDESNLARLTAKKYQTIHNELEISINLNNDIENILSLYGEPFMDSSAIPSFLVAREAKKSVGVVLNGDGADELFGGYRRYVPIATNMVRYMRYIAPFLNFLPKPNKKQSIYNYLYRLLCMANKKGLDFYLTATSDIYENIFHFQNNRVLDQMNEFILTILADTKLTALSKMLYLDFNLLLPGDLLVKMDIATMANSLEARSPFLSKHMLAFAPRLSDKYKVNKFVTKYVLRKLADNYLSPQLVNQPKRGFEVPLSKWVEIDLKQKIYDSLLPGCYSENYVSRDFIEQLLKKKKELPNEKRTKILWGLFCLEVWYRQRGAKINN